MAEDELRGSVAEDMAGHYAAWCYFQSLDREKNRGFVRRFKARYGGDRVTSDVIATAYSSVQLWAQAVREAGTDQVRQVRNALRHQSLDAAEGIIAIDPETRHAWRPVFIGRIRPDGQFDIVWPTSGADRAAAVRPVPFPLSRSRSEWERFVADLQQSWGGRWVNPARNAGQPSGGGPAR
jgi:urea transport system substrate-binding protein